MGMKAKVSLGAVVGVVVIAAVSANAGSNGKDGGSGGIGKGSSASAERTPGGAKDKKGSGLGQAAGKKKAAIAGDGEYQVGSDVKPGTYRTTGNTDDMCYWERAKDAKGETDSLLANDNVTGTSYVTVKPTDKIFKSSGCKDWEAVDPKAKGTPASSMDGDGGMYKVGTDIAPGTYKSTGNTDDSCYWERTKDAEHGLNSIIANDNVTGTAVVTISPGDAYFKTTGCGAWKKAA
ncbi:hypothetical protein FB563_3566 [Streptomyces puniciscabiei]|uniref:Lipoprotein n=1 Tax=Streptomyces puniciscabiei TaxID=164348 RepID=A0A542UHP1_9ACTN|nr:hypothetical protein [Streptomyces puniciscabiei]TQK98534.1 hypothetical protein FB563_3566 [Streptomyces puniciscabiei]